MQMNKRVYSVFNMLYKIRHVYLCILLFVNWISAQQCFKSHCFTFNVFYMVESRVGFDNVLIPRIKKIILNDTPLKNLLTNILDSDVCFKTSLVSIMIRKVRCEECVG